MVGSRSRSRRGSRTPANPRQQFLVRGEALISRINRANFDRRQRAEGQTELDWKSKYWGVGGPSSLLSHKISAVPLLHVYVLISFKLRERGREREGERKYEMDRKRQREKERKRDRKRKKRDRYRGNK